MQGLLNRIVAWSGFPCGRRPRERNCKFDGHAWQTIATQEINMELLGFEDGESLYEHTDLIQEECQYCGSTREREQVVQRRH